MTTDGDALDRQLTMLRRVSKYDYDKMLTICAALLIGTLLRGETPRLVVALPGLAILLWARTKVPRQEDMPKELTLRAWFAGRRRRLKRRARLRTRRTVKLVYCKVCYDWVALHYHPRACDCGRSGGWYKPDGDRVCVARPGTAVLFGLDNRVLVNGRADVFRYEDTGGKVEWITEREFDRALGLL